LIKELFKPEHRENRAFFALLAKFDFEELIEPEE
jgi:hypothetical protein